jgi:large subunit ribosomal protein L15
MESLSNLKKITKKGSKRVGRGAGSGKGKTAGRGTKGQNARGKISLTHSHHEGGQRPLFKRLPYRRGKGNRKVSVKPLVINIEKLDSLPKSTVISVDNLEKFGFIKKSDTKKPIKILGNVNLANIFKIDLPTSKKITPGISAENIKK